ncbi:MAG: copper amine oxidase N-terminal domain-containing protein [Oscillospiraceae bacterium]|jgi:hypothetical protein|nr:copper amine oxidase N-terminal domain-containing protein [Oscillospiraceae bacterium]
MKRCGLTLFALAITLAALLLLASCTSNAPAPSPSPSAEATGSPEPTPEATAEPSPAPEPTVSTSADAGAYSPISASATIQYDGKDINAAPYYGPDNAILLPLQPLAEAMGWKVEKSTSSEAEALLLTSSGKDDVTIQYIPRPVGQNEVAGVVAKKGVTDIQLGPQLLYADGTIYVPEAFVSDALQPVEVSLDGSGLVTVKPKP